MKIHFAPQIQLIIIILVIYFILFLAPSFIRFTSPLVADYPQGYYIYSLTTGPVRIIPLGGNKLKSPTANDPKAVFSPFGEVPSPASPASQNMQTY